jgi:hypothetical protein
MAIAKPALSPLEHEVMAVIWRRDPLSFQRRTCFGDVEARSTETRPRYRGGGRLT